MDNKLYRPKEIAELGLISVNLRVNSPMNVYQFILREIKAGNLKAKNYGSKDKEYWRVSLTEINRYNAGVDN